MVDLQQSRPAVNVAQEYPDRPAIHISLADGVPKELYQWISFGAEEEGVPCRHVAATAAEIVALAYGAAQSSRLNVGVGISHNQVAVHEFHMPAGQPVLIYEFDANGRAVCRLAGSNAARLVVGMPLKFNE